jgi:hypothetical protein
MGHSTGSPSTPLATQGLDILFDEHPGYQQGADHGLRTLGSLSQHLPILIGCGLRVGSPYAMMISLRHESFLF